VAVVLIGGAVTVTSLTASAGSSALPPRTAAQLLVDVQQAKLGALSGTVVQRADLGLPSIPGIGGGADSSDLTSLISGTHTLRVWYDGTDKARVALLGTLGESDVIKNGSQVWTWSSRDNTATHRTVTAAAGDSPRSSLIPTETKPTGAPMAPSEAAAAILRAVGPSTIVTTDSTQVVAKRPVYQLILRPRHPAGSLIARVTIAIDGATHLPLRVQVFAVSRPRPAFEIAFSSVDFSTPDSAQFAFDPPPGAHVTTVPPDAVGRRLAVVRTPAAAAMVDTHPRVVGTGWTSVLLVSASTLPTMGPLGAAVQLLPRVSGSWGSGHLLAGTMFSAVITDGGEVAVGAVIPRLLYAALAAK
jgi:outer membrane lipoprotein-sorting protein